MESPLVAMAVGRMGAAHAVGRAGCDLFGAFRFPIPMTAPKRRWPRFSLRTLFVAVTVFGCWLGYELNWIRQRHAALVKWDDSEFLVPPPTAPGLLRLFGEPGYGYISISFEWHDGALSGTLTEQEEAEIKMARRLFPEAKMVGWNWGRPRRLP